MSERSELRVAARRAPRSDARLGGAAAGAAVLTVSENGGHLVGPPIVAVGDRTVQVSVSLAVPQVVPFFPDVVTRVQLEPRERFIPEDQR